MFPPKDVTFTLNSQVKFMVDYLGHLMQQCRVEQGVSITAVGIDCKHQEESGFPSASSGDRKYLV